MLRELYPDLVLGTTVPDNVKVREAHGRYLSVLQYAAALASRGLTCQ